MFARLLYTTIVAAALGAVSVQAAPPGGTTTKPVKRPGVTQRVPFYKQMSLADRRLASHAYDLLWQAAGTQEWDRVRQRLRQLLVTRVVAGPWEAPAVTGLTYCYLFGENIPRFDAEEITSDELGRFQRWLLANPNLTRRLIFALTPQDRPDRAVGVLHDLYSRTPKTVLRYPDLAVAMAIVFDKRRASLHQRRDTFRWLTHPKRKSPYDLQAMPHELARYLVELRVTREEFKWAYGRHRDRWNLDNVYHDVEYDFEAHIGKRPKDISGQDYTLMNLQAFGGTCGDQAYYASQVGRVLGIPVAEIEHHGPGIVGHCWCLQLHLAGGEFTWRPAGGEGFGWVVDPATGRRGTDQTLEFGLRSLRRGLARREMAAALTQVALRVGDWLRREVDVDPQVLQAIAAGQDQVELTEKDRATSYYRLERELDPRWVLGKALEADPYNANAWAAVEELAQREQFTPPELAALLQRLASLTGDDHPDVLYFALLACHTHLPSADERRLLEAARKSLTPDQMERAPELAADLLLLAGDLYAAEGKLAAALDRYEESISVKWEFPPIVIRAVERALPIAKETGDLDRFGRICTRVFDRTRDPKFGLEVARLISEAGLNERAVKWLREVYDRGETDAPGRFEALREAIGLLIELDKPKTAAKWGLELYDATMHPGDGLQVVAVLRSMGEYKAASRLQHRVKENELKRRQEVERDSARRSDL